MTLNVADFESRVLRDVGVAILTPGALVGRVLDDSQRSSLGRSVTWQTAGSNPPRTAIDIAELLAAHPTMATPMAALRERLED